MVERESSLLSSSSPWPWPTWSLTLLYTGGGGIMVPHSEISSCTSRIPFWGVSIGWQFLFTLILSGNIYFWAKNYIEKVLEYHFWGKGHFSRAMRGIFLKLQRYVRGQNRGSWGWQSQLDNSQVCSMCISHVCMCLHVYEIHVLYTCYTPGSCLVVLVTLKNLYFHPSINSIALEIKVLFLLKIFKNWPLPQIWYSKTFSRSFLSQKQKESSNI